MGTGKAKFENQWVINVGEDFIRNPGLSLQAKAIFILLKSYSDKNFIAYPSIDTLKRQTGNGKNSIHRYIRELMLQGYIKKNRERAGRGLFNKNSYQIISEIQVQNLGMDKQAKNPFPFYDAGKQGNSINILLSNNIELCSALLKNFNSKEQTAKDKDTEQLSKILNKFKDELEDKEIKKIVFNLLGNEKEFEDTGEIAAYLQKCVQNKNKNSFVLSFNPIYYANGQNID